MARPALASPGATELVVRNAAKWVNVTFENQRAHARVVGQHGLCSGRQPGDLGLDGVTPSGPTAAATVGIASICTVTVFVAGTARSGPAPSSIPRSATAASSDVASLLIPMTREPARRNRPARSTISGGVPDWDNATTSQPANRRALPSYAVLRLGVIRQVGRSAGRLENERRRQRAGARSG